MTPEPGDLIQSNKLGCNRYRVENTGRNLNVSYNRRSFAMIDIDDVIGCAILDPEYYFDVEGHALKLFNELKELQRKANFNCYTKCDFLKDKKVEHWCKLEKYIWRSLGFKIKDIRAYRDREHADYIRCIR